MIDVKITYDNSTGNPENPNNPPQLIRWGPQSSDEMGSVTLLVVAVDEKDTQKLKDSIRQHRRQHQRGEYARRGWAISIITQLYMRDRNADGLLVEEELSRRQKRYLPMLDHNKDGALSVDEVESLLKLRR